MSSNNKIVNWVSSLFVITAVNIGGALEWYEIGLFISWPIIILEDSSIAEQTITDSIAAGFFLIIGFALASGVVRGLGGWFFGSRGDKKGRKYAFALSIMLATLPSLIVPLISFFIPYKLWYEYAVIIFALVKLLQGIPAGGEFPGAICYLAETGNIYHNSPSWISRRYMCSYTVLGPQIGLMLSMIVCLVLKSFFSSEFLMKEGWRYVFIFSGLIGLAGFLLRSKLHETASFMKIKIHNAIDTYPLKTVFSNFLPELGFGFILSIFETVLFIVISLIPLFYSKSPFYLSYTEITYLSLASTILRTMFLILIGHLLVKFTTFPWLKSSAWGVVFICVLLYLSFIKGYFLLSIYLNLILIFLYSIQAAILPSLLAELFPTRVRYTGIAFSFNICDGILLSIVTSICFLIMSKDSPSFIFILPICAFIFLINMKNKLANIKYYR